MVDLDYADLYLMEIFEKKDSENIIKNLAKTYRHTLSFN